MSSRVFPHLGALLVLFALVLIPAVCGQPLNQLPNGSFEGGSFAGWSGAGGAVGNTNDAHDGLWSAQLTTQTLSASLDLASVVEAKCTAWLRFIRTTGVDTGWGGFRLEVLSQDWKTLAHSGWLLERTHGTNWFKIALRFTPTTAQTRLQVGYFGDAARVMTTRVDDLRVFAKPASNTAPTVSATLTPAILPAVPGMQDFQVVADDADGAIERVYWDFGDGACSTATRGSRRVGVPGAFEARLLVADDDGAVTATSIRWQAEDHRFPTLQVDAPVDEVTTNQSAAVRLSGTCTGDQPLLLVSTDRGILAPVHGTTTWSSDVPLLAGWNRVLIQVRDAAGRIVTRERRIRRVSAAPLAILDLELGPSSVSRWTMLEVTCSITNLVATHTRFPYEVDRTPGLEWVDGITVDGVFTPDDWRTVFRRPGFLQQRYLRALKGGEEWMYPTNPPVWTVRFAPPHPGQWRGRVEATDASGSAVSTEGVFVVTQPVDPHNHGPSAVSATDSRYFEYADGTTFLGTGHNLAFSPERYSYDAEDRFTVMGRGNQQFFRWWIAGHLWSSAWQPWNSRTLGYNGTVPRTGLSLESRYGFGMVSAKLDTANPILFQGWMSGRAGLLRNRTYLARVRWRTTGVTGPANAGQPFGVCLKLTGWPEPGQTGSLPILVPHAFGDTPWHVATGTFTASTDLLPNLALILENTTGGTAFVDEVALHEVLPDQSPGPQLLRSPCFNSHLHFDSRRGAGIDAILSAAEARNASFQLNISEKQEELLNWLGPDGLPDPLGGHFNAGPGSASHRLHSYYWRHLFAHFGASRALHSWELVNEEDPNNLSHFRFAADFARRAAADGNPHPASTSTWAGFASVSWSHADSAPLAYADFHAYVRSTGELTPKEELANDSARFFHEYDLAARAQNFGKPIVWGEMGIDGAGGSDEQDPLLTQDTTGVWLHKIVWARAGPGGVYPLYWYTDNLQAHSLHFRFGAWNRFMDGIPLHNGRYIDAEATSSQPAIRVIGQRDPFARRAHLWIDNRHHTWRAVVAGSNIPPVSATVTLALGAPNAAYSVHWYQTTNGMVLNTQSLTADSDGRLNLEVEDLRTDTAARIEPVSPGSIQPRIHSIEWSTNGIRLAWQAEAGRRYRILNSDDLVTGGWSVDPVDVVPPGTRGEFWSTVAPPPRQFFRLELRE